MPAISADGLEGHHTPTPSHPTIRPEVQHYLRVCEDLLAGVPESEQPFIDATVPIQKKTRSYNDEELMLVRDMVLQQRVQTRVGFSRFNT